MPYLWEKPEDCKERYVAAYDEEHSPDRFLFYRGMRLSPEQVMGKPQFDMGLKQAQIATYDCIPNNSASPLVNQRIVDLLMQLAPNEVQFFDAEVRCKDGVLTNYKLLNATTTIVGIDHEKSVYTMMVSAPDAISGFKYLTYKPGCMGKHHIVRDKEYLSNFLVSEIVKQVFEKNHITGIWFARPEEWYDNYEG